MGKQHLFSFASTTIRDNVMEPRKKYENVKVSVSKWSSHNKYSYIVMPPIIIIFLAENMVTLSRQCCLVPTIDSKTMFMDYT